MQVRELMSGGPAVVTPQETLGAAGRAMVQRRCGFLPVVEAGTLKPVGVLTDRDMLRHLVATDEPASRATVGAAMTRKVHSIDWNADLEEAATIMARAAIHRLPVVDGDRVVGVLSLEDIAQAAKIGAKKLGPNPAERQMADILEAIAAARSAHI